MIDGPDEICLLDKPRNTNVLKKLTISNYQMHDTLPHLTKFPEWISLVEECERLKMQSLNQLFKKDQYRYDTFNLNAVGLELNFSHQPVNKKTINLLTEIASKYNLQMHIDNLFSGDRVNKNENKPALHTALRSDKADVVKVNGENIKVKIQNTLLEMEQISSSIRKNTWFKSDKKTITDIVNIGIGGSDLGPKMAVGALKEYKTTDISCHFISDNDPDSADDLLDELNPDSTIFIVASKSFTTHETIINLRKAIEWLGTKNKISEHIIAVTANIKYAHNFKIKHVLPIWDWIGGRFSFFSSINLILMIAIGPELFQQLLAGAKEMDDHFKTAPFEQNMPVLLALLGIWNLNFLAANNHLLLVYSQRLTFLTPYLQQLDMESNGKSLNISQTGINYSTGPIVWGGLGNQAEHAYYQLLFQGTHYTPIDYIFINEKKYESTNLAANKKLNALAFGTENQKNSHHHANARVGINKITLNSLNPKTLGALISLFEHKIYCQSVIWRINAFDQPGVDAAKKFNMET
jgi:glucose-6-phosphate isomerase